MSAVAALHAFADVHNHNEDDAEDEDTPRSYIHKRYEPYRFEHAQPPRFPSLLHPPTPPTTTATTTTAGSYDDEQGRPYTHLQGGLVGPAAYGQPEDHERYTPQQQPFDVYISEGGGDGMANSTASPPRTGTGTGGGDNTLPSLKDAVRFSSDGGRFKSDFAPPPPPQPQQQPLDYASEDYADFDNSYPAQSLYSPSDVQQQRDAYGDDGNAVYYPSGGGGGGDLQHPAYRRFSTPSTGFGNAAPSLDQDQDVRNSYRPPFRWSADFTSTSTGNTPASEYGYHHPHPLPSSFAPPAPPQHSHYQPQYMQSANPYHQPVPYAHGGTYQHPAYSCASAAAVPHLFLPSHHHQPPQSGTAYEQHPSGGAFAPPPRPGAAESAGAGAPPSLRLDTSHSALLGHGQQQQHHQVSPHSATATVQQPPSGRAVPPPSATSPWSGPPPPTSLSLGASASSLAARRRNTTDFSLLNASRPAAAAAAAADRPRLSSTDNDSTGSSSTTTAGPRLSLSASTSMSGLSSGPTSATSAPRGSGNSSGGGSGGVATLASIKEPLPSSSPERDRSKSDMVKSSRRRRRSEGEGAADEEEEEAEQEQEGEEVEEEDEDVGDDLEEDEDGGDDQDGEYRPSGSRRQQQRKSARQSTAAEDPPRRRAGGAAARTATTTAGGSDSLHRRSTMSVSSTAGPSERPSKRRKSETDADGGPLDKKFTCPHPSCGRSFARNFNLQSHIKSHQGIREFKCPECFKLFSRKHDCTRHCISIHNYDKDGVAPPDRQPLFVAQNVLPVNVMVERAQERQRAATSAASDSGPDTQTSRNGSTLANHAANQATTANSSAATTTTTAPLFSGRPLALKRDAETTSPLMSHAPFVPPHPAYGNQYHRNYPPPGSSDNGYAYHAQQQRLSPAHAFGNQPLPPPSLSFDHSSSSVPPPPSAGPDTRQQRQQ